MTAPVFLLDPLPAGPSLRLAGAEGRHAATVLRLRAGESADVTDGRGSVAHCEVTGTARDVLNLAVRARTVTPPPVPRLTVVQALPKGERGELAVDVLTEVGADEIVPWRAARCVTRWQGDRGARALERWRSAARAAAKQSRRTWWPAVTEPVSTSGVAALLAAAAVPVVLHEEADLPLVCAPPSDGAQAGAIVLVVGPEGGITAEELAAFAAAGAAAYRLGPTVLRTSTAGVVAAAALLSRTARWGAAAPVPRADRIARSDLA